ncbi:protein of unknown function [Acidaminobacter hydrogenoformans DSM 2784]|uniref:DUF1850 domain-containing protein n=1 Tax=Acidaminobacter hydrogenoformans DSM 2784 TaxID=1120920 RepID=A0A1G5S0J2_9FIRM|nr:protein of unknown function [Acidaminobacter hydrogenoformans DSM 2784]
MIIAIILLLICLSLWPVIVLVIYNDSADDLLYFQRIETPYIFKTEIIHSVHLTKVYETFEINSNGIISVVNTSFYDIGWGSPGMDGEIIHQTDNVLYINEIDKEINFIPLRVSYFTQPKLILNNEHEIPIYKYVRDNDRVDIFSLKMKFVEYLYRLILK